MFICAHLFTFSQFRTTQLYNATIYHVLQLLHAGSSLHSLSLYLRSGLLIDCFKTIEYLDFNFGPKTISKESKIYCISDCLRKGCNSAKSDCLVSTKNMTCFKNLEQLSRVPTENDQYILKEQR